MSRISMCSGGHPPMSMVRMSAAAGKLRVVWMARINAREPRGYGQARQRLRKMWEGRVATGAVLCRPCDKPIEPGTPWDLGHDDQDRTRPAMPERRRCNRSQVFEREHAAKADDAAAEGRKWSRRWFGPL